MFFFSVDANRGFENNKVKKKMEGGVVLLAPPFF